MKTDLSYLRQMSHDDPVLISEIIDIFAQQVGDYSKKMRDHYERKEWMELSKLAHKAKSSVAIVGMNDLAERLKDLEILAKQESKTELFPEYIQQFTEDCEIAVAELEDYRKSLN